MPQYVISQAPGKVVLRNFAGVITTYTEPNEYHSECNCPECQAERRKKQVAANKAVDGVISLLEGERMNIEPKALKRHERNKKRNQK